MEKSQAGLTPEELNEFKALLLAKRSELIGDVVCMEGETLRRNRTELSNMPIHLADAGSDHYHIENTLGLMDSERKLIVQIDGALGRIEKGTYGICQGNSEPIPKERLKAIPWAEYCVACAGLKEKGILRRGPLRGVVFEGGERYVRELLGEEADE